jgi:surface carbohydrate biosynthesis protein
MMNPCSRPHEYPWVVIPIETKAREFHSKLLLSCVAAEAGFGVILGNKNILEQNVRFLPRGLFIGNSIVSEKARMFRRYRALGYKVAAWCEEGITYRNRREYRHDRVSADAVAEVEAFFAWGEYHAEDVRLGSHPRDVARIIPTGNPRFDLLRPELRSLYQQQTEELKKKHGPLILINTNFHRYNHFLGKGSYLEGLRARGKLHTPEQEEFSRRWIEFLGVMYHHFAEMIPAVSRAFPGHKIVVRPHPSEDFGAWRRDLAGVPNVEVLHEGNVVPWILASSAVIHNSCATGTEAFVLGVPVLAYRPITSAEYDSHLPNAVSLQVRTVEELIAALRRVIELDPHPSAAAGTPEQREAANHYFSGLQGPLASERIVAALKRIDIPPRPFAATVLQGVFQNAARWSWPPLRAFLRRVVKGKNPLSAYLDQKFPGLELREVRDAVHRLGLITGRFNNLAIEEISRCTFRIVKQEGGGNAQSVGHASC